MSDTERLVYSVSKAATEREKAFFPRIIEYRKSRMRAEIGETILGALEEHNCHKAVIKMRWSEEKSTEYPYEVMTLSVTLEIPR